MLTKIDYTTTGGFPLTQDVLGTMQDAYTSAIDALCATRGPGPYILSGCVVSNSLSSISLTDGYICYNGTPYRVQGGSIGNIFLFPFQAGLALTVSNTPLTYNNASVNATALQEQYFAFTTIPNGTLSSAQIPLTSLQPYSVEATYTTVATGGHVSGNVYYRKNYMTNTLHLYGTLTVLASGLAATQVYTGSNVPTGPIYYDIAPLAAPYLPARDTPFTLYVRYHDSLFLDDLGQDFITQLNGEVKASGDISVGLIKPATSITSYNVYFNTVIPLD